MNSQQRRTLARVLAEPAPADLRWRDIDTLLRALGADISKGSGSRVRVALGGVRAVFHRPHPGPNAKRSLVRAVRDFLIAAAVTAPKEHDDA